MSYCVHCGVELEQTARACPLCGTPVSDPKAPIDTAQAPPFPTVSATVEPPNKSELALLLSAMLVSVSVVCTLLNLVLSSGSFWSLYIVGGAMTFWLWIVTPLVFPKSPLWLRLLIDGMAVALYLYLISLDLDGLHWYLALALPITLVITALALALGLLLPHRSILTCITLTLCAVGLLCLAIELFIDLYKTGLWRPAWSLVVAAAVIALMVPLIVVRRVPGLREQVRRKFHL